MMPFLTIDEDGELVFHETSENLNEFLEMEGETEPIYLDLYTCIYLGKKSTAAGKQ